MTKKYHDTEYLYLSACIHSWETRLLTPERREQLLSAPTDRDAARVLEEMGWPAFDPESEAALDQAVGRRREELFARLGKDMPDARILDVFRLPTDYHNLKVLVKSRGENCRRLLMAGGRWDPEQLLSDYRQRDCGTSSPPRRHRPYSRPVRLWRRPATVRRAILCWTAPASGN